MAESIWEVWCEAANWGLWLGGRGKEGGETALQTKCSRLHACWDSGLGCLFTPFLVAVLCLRLQSECREPKGSVSEGGDGEVLRGKKSPF